MGKYALILLLGILSTSAVLANSGPAVVVDYDSRAGTVTACGLAIGNELPEIFDTGFTNICDFNFTIQNKSLGNARIEVRFANDIHKEFSQHTQCTHNGGNTLPQGESCVVTIRLTADIINQGNKNTIYPVIFAGNNVIPISAKTFNVTTTGLPPF